MKEPFTGVKVFSATMLQERATLGEKITDWLGERRRAEDFRVVEIVVTQSSDDQFHMLAITVFYAEPSRVDASRLVRRPADTDPLDGGRRAVAGVRRLKFEEVDA